MKNIFGDIICQKVKYLNKVFSNFLRKSAQKQNPSSNPQQKEKLSTSY